ncbi:hypothetical protein NJ7G_0504 [Natrinema sp. J7-2]|nr:hypothetical protein NJ7G_0504 [Natrinema sp. J7-2]
MEVLDPQERVRRRGRGRRRSGPLVAIAASVVCCTSITVVRPRICHDESPGIAK